MIDLKSGSGHAMLESACGNWLLKVLRVLGCSRLQANGLPSRGPRSLGHGQHEKSESLRLRPPHGEDPQVAGLLMLE